jgi:hypothetical protein
MQQRKAEEVMLAEHAEAAEPPIEAAPREEP